MLPSKFIPLIHVKDLPIFLGWLHTTLSIEILQELENTPQELRIFRLDMSSFRLKLTDRTPCIEIPHKLRSNLTDSQLHQLIQEVIANKSWHRRNILVLIDGDKADLRLLFRTALLPPIILDRTDQAHIMAGNGKDRRLTEEISKLMPIAALSPYETGRHVVGGQFFGRESELRKISLNSETNFLIIGNRRMGKTSLAQESLRISTKTAKYHEATHIYWDCSNVHNKTEFCVELIRLIGGPQHGPREASRFTNGESTFSMGSFLNRMAKAHGEGIFLVLDEVDHILAWDSQNNWEVMNLLRSVSANKSISDTSVNPLRLVMCGFRLAQQVAANIKSPLYNGFAQSLQMYPFKHKEVEEIVVEPLLNLGIRIHDRNELVNRIYTDTSGQPNLVQHYCQYILRRLEETESRDVFPKILNDLIIDDQIRHRLVWEMAMNTDPLERLILLCAARSCYRDGQTSRFGNNFINAWLHELHVNVTFSQIEHALMMLETASIFNYDGVTYGFAMQVLPRMLCMQGDLKTNIQKLVKEGFK